MTVSSARTIAVLVAAAAAIGTLGATAPALASTGHWAAAGVLNGANADFDGDGSSDFTMLGFDAGPPYDTIWDTAFSSGGSSVNDWGHSLDRIMVGDYNGDHRTDQVVVRTASNGQLVWYELWGGGTTKTVNWGSINLGDEPVTGDFDGDGRDDPAVLRPNCPQTGVDCWVVLGSSAGRMQIPWGANNLGDMPVTGDFDGDGKTDPAVIRTAANGQYTWVIRRSSGGTEHVPWGTKALYDHPVVGDFDGDGRTDFAVVRPDSPSKGLYTWAIYYANGLTDHIQWGANSSDDVPVAGDFDGDGATDLAVVRPDGSTYMWAIRKSSGGTMHVLFGNEGFYTPLTLEFAFQNLYFPSNPIH